MMKKTKRLSPWLTTLSLALGLVSVAVGTAHAQPAPATQAAEASVVLGNTAESGDAAPVAAEAVAVDATPSAEKAPETKAAEAEPAKDPREVYRDRLLQVPEMVPASTSAASRRYRKMDLSAYRALMQSSAPAPKR
jgi:hypothetical protein